jgi:hypothetical protein
MKTISHVHGQGDSQSLLFLREIGQGCLGLATSIPIRQERHACDRGEHRPAEKANSPCGTQGPEGCSVSNSGIHLLSRSGHAQGEV